MLFSLGPVVFTVQPFNAHGLDHSHETDYAAKPVVGIRPPLEWVGEGAETWTISGRLFPEKLGGLDDLAKLAKARAAGKPLYLQRGDGTPLGWVVVERVTEKSTYLDASGIGRVVEFDVAVKRADKPSAGSYYSVVSGLFQ